MGVKPIPEELKKHKPYKTSFNAAYKIFLDRMNNGLFADTGGISVPSSGQFQYRTDTDHSIAPEIIYMNKRSHRL